MNGGYVLLDLTALDFTDATKQSVVFTDRLEEITKLKKPVIADTGVTTPVNVVITESSGDYTISFLVGTTAITILCEDDGSTITETSIPTE